MLPEEFWILVSDCKSPAKCFLPSFDQFYCCHWFYWFITVWVYIWAPKIPKYSWLGFSQRTFHKHTHRILGLSWTHQIIPKLTLILVRYIFFIDYALCSKKKNCSDDKLDTQWYFKPIVPQDLTCHLGHKSHNHSWLFFIFLIISTPILDPGVTCSGLLPCYIARCWSLVYDWSCPSDTGHGTQ